LPCGKALGVRSFLSATTSPPIVEALFRKAVRDVLAAADQRSIPVVLISGDRNQALAVDPTPPFLPKPSAQGILLAVLDSARR
jgi:hypothetical protein